MISRGFIASVPSYKAKFAKWNIRHNATLDDMKYLGMVIRDQNLHDVEPAHRPRFWINGRCFYYHHVARRLKDAGLSLEHLGPTVPKPNHINIETHQERGSDRADSCPLLNLDEAPEDDAAVFIRAGPPSCGGVHLESAEPGISNYVKGAFENGQFIVNDVGELVNRSSEQGAKNLSTFHIYFNIGIDFWDRQLPNEAFLWFRKASALVQELLKDQDPRLLEIFADVSILLHAKGLGDLYNILLRQMCAMVQIEERTRHAEMQPWALMFSQLGKASGPDLITTIERGWKCGYDQFVSSPLGPSHAVNISCRLNYLVRTQGKLDAGKTLDSSWAHVMPETNDYDTSLQQRFAYGKFQYLQGKFCDALKSMFEILRLCEQASRAGVWKWWRLEIDAIELSARCYHDIDMQRPGSERFAEAEATLKRAINGAILAAALPIFVTSAGSGFWFLVRFATHQARAASVDPNDVSNPLGHDGLYCQQQVVLRNADTPSGAAWTVTKITWAWRNASIKSISRSLPLLVIAILVYISFAAASLLTAQVQSAATTDVLIVGTTCGVWNFTGEPTVVGSEAAAKFLAQTRAAALYARKCYDSDAEGTQCSQFASQAIGYAIDSQAKCPFAGDSDIHLGINAPYKQRLQVQKVTTCSPLDMTGYQRAASDVTGSLPYSWNDTFVENLLGPNLDNNYTYRYNLHGAYDDVGYGYTLDAVAFYAGADGNAWSPISEIRPEDADLTVLFLGSDHVVYNTVVADPFYRADVQGLPVNDTDPPYYIPNRHITAMACLDQYRFCNPALADSCTPLTSLSKVLNAVPDIGLSDWQHGTKVRIGYYLTLSSIYYSVAMRGAAALMASDTLLGSIQPSLPDNQYELELMNWFNISLARLQQGVVEYASGPSQLGTTGRVYVDNSLIERALCHSQKIRSPKGYYNFSVFGVGIIVVAGLLLIILGLCLDAIVGGIKRYIGRGEYSSMAWALDQELQLQRMAYEGHGWPGWDHNDDSIPFMTRGGPIGRYTDAGRHPTIHAPLPKEPER
ncbi:hypothetical protein B0A48_15111 [Cryoendolithus antarcticus]|uniref:Uncharacterized protein n=1 Tax=Cryoendolithus antarcticus TaxID=1507870 RepID=A0A1V8SJE7_9PEZI|nr:hypothetical protein B0A48_15111 [Cryoendolithus antarcticus]